MIPLRRVASLSLLVSLVACGGAFEGGAAGDTSGSSPPGSTSTGSGGGATATGTGSGGGDTTTGAGGGGTTTTTGSGGGGGDTTTTSASVEDCTNGADDDDDGATDCADSGCADVACTPPLPGGWDGPVWLAVDATVPPACPDGSTELAALHVGPPVAEDAGCSCICSPKGGSCASKVNVLAYEDGSCSAGYSLWGALADGACHPVDLAAALSFALEPRLVDDAPTCGPVVVKDAPPPVAVGEARLCAPDAVGGGCADGAACQRSPGALVTCVYTQGDHECPDGAFSARTLLYEDAVDGRDCACECEAALSFDCSAHAELWKGQGCMGDLVGSLVEDVCFDASKSGAQSMKIVAPAGPPQATCGVPTKSEPTGGVTLVGAITVCCSG